MWKSAIVTRNRVIALPQGTFGRPTFFVLSFFCCCLDSNFTDFARVRARERVRVRVPPHTRARACVHGFSKPLLSDLGERRVAAGRAYAIVRACVQMQTCLRCDAQVRWWRREPRCDAAGTAHACCTRYQERESTFTHQGPLARVLDFASPLQPRLSAVLSRIARTVSTSSTPLDTVVVAIFPYHAIRARWWQGQQEWSGNAKPRRAHDSSRSLARTEPFRTCRPSCFVLSLLHLHLPAPL